MKIQSVEDLFLTGLQYAYDAEKQLTQALPEIAESVTAPQLREAFEQHLRETKEHVRRLEEVFRQLGVSPEASPNTILRQMRQEAGEIIENLDKSEILDAALIVAGNQIEHYEIAAYGSLRSFAQVLCHDDIVDILQKTLDEEKRADAKLTEVAESQVNIQALHKSIAMAAS